MNAETMSRDHICARLVSYGILCAAAVGLVLVIVLNSAGHQ